MVRISSILPAIAVGVATTLLPTSSAYSQAYVRPPRFELTPFAGYQWGGSFDTDAISNILAGELSEDDSYHWGLTVSLLAPRGAALELIYLRQDTDIQFKPNVGSSLNVGSFSNNYIHLGGRFEALSERQVRPFLTASLGVNVMDPEIDGVGSTTRFSWALGGGVKAMFSRSVGFRADIRWWSTPVPSGDYGAWCDFWGCYAVEGTAWVNQGQLSGGLIFSF